MFPEPSTCLDSCPPLSYLVVPRELHPISFSSLILGSSHMPTCPQFHCLPLPPGQHGPSSGLSQLCLPPYVYILFSSLDSLCCSPNHLLQTPSSNLTKSFISPNTFNDQQFPMVLAVVKGTLLLLVAMKPRYKFSPFTWKMDLLKAVQES